MEEITENSLYKETCYLKGTVRTGANLIRRPLVFCNIAKIKFLKNLIGICKRYPPSRIIIMFLKREIFLNKTLQTDLQIFSTEVACK